MHALVADPLGTSSMAWPIRGIMTRAHSFFLVNFPLMRTFVSHRSLLVFLNFPIDKISRPIHRLNTIVYFDLISFFL